MEAVGVGSPFGSGESMSQPNKLNHHRGQKGPPDKWRRRCNLY